MRIEPASLDRLPEIVDLNRSIFQGMYPWPPFDLAQYEERLAHADPVIWTAEDRGMVGNSVSYVKNGSWHIWILGVIPEYRRQGAASGLLQANEEHARMARLPVSASVYNVSKDMQRLMLKRGYRIATVEQNRHGSLYKVHFVRP